MPKPRDLQVFVAADAAYAAFEEAVLDARASVIGSFRVFDLMTTLVSDRARAVGSTWFDLLADALTRGVHVNIVISDFDPIYATALHQQSMCSLRQAAALSEVSGAGPAQLNIRLARHPATPGAMPKWAFMPSTLARRAKARAALSDDAQTLEAPELRNAALPSLHTVSHHQKLAVIDTDTLYIGGLDLNDRRFDTADHDRPAHQTWSDVQVMIRNHSAVTEARTHLETFEASVEGHALPPAPRHLLRTLSSDRRFKLPFLSPRIRLNEIEEAHLSGFARARHLIHIETQFFRSSLIADAMAEAATRRPDLTCILILPALPEAAAFVDEIDLDTRFGLDLECKALATVKAAFGDRITIACPVQPTQAPRDSRATHAGSPIIYVHNKVLMVDEETAIVGSANLNGRSLHWDTEAALQMRDADHIATLRAALARHWWRREVATEWLAPNSMQPLWDAEIKRNTLRRPEARQGFLVTHSTAEHAANGQALPLVTEDMV